MNFPNVQVLSASSRSEFFGENVRWKTALEINVEGSFLALQASNNSQIHSQINSFESSNFSANTFFSNVSINGTNFGNGYINNFTARPDGDDVNDKKYTATIIIPQGGSLNQSIEGLNGGIEENFKYVTSFSESSIFTKGEGIKDSYSQTISLSLVPDQKSSGKNIATAIINKFISNNSLTSLINGQYTSNNIKKYYEQTYDEQSNSYSININYDLYTRQPDSSTNVLVTKNVSINYGSNGVVLATENGECIGNGQTDRLNTAISQAKNLLGSSLNNLNASYNTSTYGALIPTPISQSFVIVTFENRASYSITYTTSKELIDKSGFWEYSITIDTSDGGDVIGTEEGTITGIGENNKSNDKFKKAESLFKSKIGGASSRIQKYSSKKNLKKISNSITYSEVQGVIKYNEKYSSNQSILDDNGSFTKSLSNTTTDILNKNLYSTFNIVNNKEIAQIQANLLQKNITYNVILNGKASISPGEYLDEALSQVTSQNYISDFSFSFSSSEREGNLNVTYFEMLS